MVAQAMNGTTEITETQGDAMNRGCSVNLRELRGSKLERAFVARRRRKLEPHVSELEAQAHLADPAEDGRRQLAVLEAGEEIAQAPLQRVRCVDDRSAGVVEGEGGRIARRPGQRL